ncbi:uncharacterized protein LOC122883434 isoform X2 [Siniperca chuatsi]|uniref:uncharacterized protein LOC122883434 isoform X2 n=2 Tax=Siniperca chuatsi TaxID=119488 RepID=UPI001CE134D5|nr:uncharacterized protein LOC122883434 isoform X2 [Siniperca chuatsi]
MDEMRLDELCLGAGLEVEDVRGRPEVEDKDLHPPCEPQETPNKRDVSNNEAVTMETRMAAEPTKKKEEERWRELYPEIKKCVIVITRQRLDRLDVLKLKQEKDGERRGGGRSGDPEPSSDWMEPLELDDSGGGRRFRRFVKKVDVKVQANHAPANSTRRTRGRPRRSGLLRLRQSQSPDVTADPAHHCCSLQSTGQMERWRRIRRNDKEINNNISQSDADHNYSLTSKGPDTPDAAGDTPNSQSQDVRLSSCCGHKNGDSCSSSTEKKNRHTIVFRKVGGDQWVLRRSADKEEEEEEEEGKEEEQEDGDISINTEPMKMKTKRKENPPTYTPTPSPRLKRRTACKQCAACLREDCGKCIYCRDMRKFGGPGTKRQKCRFRVCLVVMTRKTFRPQPPEAEEETVTTETTRIMATQPRQHQRRRRTGEKKEEVKKRRRRSWGRRTAKRESEDHSWTQPLTEEEEEEEEPKKETHPPQFPLFALVSGAGTHIQLNLTVDSSHFTPSMLSASTLGVSSLSGRLPPEESVLRVSGLTYIPPPPPPLHPLLLQPKEEEEAVEIRRKRAEDGGTAGETAGRAEQVEACSEGVTDRGMYYEIEVEVPGSDSDEETPTESSTPSEVAEVADDVVVSDPAYEPPEFISLSSGSVGLLGGGVSDEVTRGRSLSWLLRALRRTVLPAHWVAVLTDGPLLQLLQCSRLSSMADTIVHVRPDRCVYVTVRSRRLPDTHALYRAHTQRITRLSQLVSLLLELERLIVCRGSRVRSPACRLQVRSPTCHLLVAPPCLTCLPCLLREEEEEEEEGTEVEEDGDEGGGEVREDELSVSLSPSLL